MPPNVPEPFGRRSSTTTSRVAGVCSWTNAGRSETPFAPSASGSSARSARGCERGARRE
jgi:hypothetical protein